MSKSFFVSDIHFGLQPDQQESRKMERFEHLAEIVRKDGEALYLVGDILDYWMEFRHVIPKYFDGCLCLLKGLVRQGVEVHYHAGNHDFYLGDFFNKSLGVQTWYGIRETFICGKKFIIAHGDGLDRNDIGYRLFVKLVRNRFNLFLLSNLQPDLAIAIMRKFSRLSRKHGRPDTHGESDFLFQYADAMAREKDFDYFVCGHSHVRGQKQLSNNRSEYINLGTWINGEYPYGVCEGGVFTLRQL
ncbi:UDP-2,3-diacylglucosamine diphosphatase [Prosthecochloris sp. SCSIO W1101]|uniref:UDP-2,3-diacylglucosamine diphosphatase n=1 Tax=Prosthecochloris sp. SCSIO W1101 TaxID=2992242 RepID=UPI00223E7B9E|nr:UDP-2,3-diacylglucosamine diphosphatase [Prosthecochloris sp. SCSIO W1101]UZJ41763.1 UDP-2,3-diacylglucosamine diphosphatase [Prosthecochloris sp. SCSIO W1101]